LLFCRLYLKQHRTRDFFRSSRIVRLPGNVFFPAAYRFLSSLLRRHFTQTIKKVDANIAFGSSRIEIHYLFFKHSLSKVIQARQTCALVAGKAS